MTNIEEQLRILKNLIKGEEYITQADLQRVVAAMEKDEIQTRPKVDVGVERRLKDE